MLKSVILAAVLVVFCAPAADAALRPQVFVNGGVSPPVIPDSFADGSTLGIGGGIGLGIQLASRLTVLVAVDYTAFGLDGTWFREGYVLPIGSPLADRWARVSNLVPQNG